MPSNAKTQKRFEQIVRRFRGKRIGVLGDFMLDELLRGEATRISPEAPVPVVLMRDETRPRGFPGGAGNVVANIAALGGRPIPFGALGADESGRKLIALLESRRVPCRSLIQVRGRVTPRKVRVVAHQHQLLRLDYERPADISERAAETLSRRFSASVGSLDALIISDYRKGTVTTALSRAVTLMARARRVPVFVDPKPERLDICREATVATPNLREAEVMAGLSLGGEREREESGPRLREKLGCTYLVITRGGEGMTLVKPNGEVVEVQSDPRPVYDVTGAGDTVIAVLALAYCAGAEIKEAVKLANLAGSRVVLKFGTAEISPRELLGAGASEN